LQHAGIVNRLPAGPILDLVSATRAVGDDQFFLAALRTRGSNVSSAIFIETS